MSHRPYRTRVANLSQEIGLTRPDAGWWAWLRDLQFVAAVLAAAPVWLALGLTVGDRMQVPAGLSATFSFVLARPIAEEFVFRGVLQGQLLRWSASRTMGPFTIANLGTTAGFVFLHFAAQPPAWALSVAVPSLVFGHMRDRFGSVLPAMILHAIYNAGFALTAWWLHR